MRHLEKYLYTNEIGFIQFLHLLLVYFVDFIFLLLNGVPLWCLLDTRALKRLQRMYVHHTFPVLPKVSPSFSSSTSLSTFIWSCQSWGRSICILHAFSKATVRKWKMEKRKENLHHEKSFSRLNYNFSLEGLYDIPL